jgi:uncharacterized membrane protein
MSENTRAALLFSITGMVYIGIGIPLLLGRVPPNSWYGARTMKTLSNDTIWYAVNRVTGRDLVIGGVAVIVACVAIIFFGQSLHPNSVALLLLTILVLSTVMMVIDSLRAQRSL